MEQGDEKAVGGKTQNKYCAIGDGVNRFMEKKKK